MNSNTGSSDNSIIYVNRKDACDIKTKELLPDKEYHVYRTIVGIETGKTLRDVDKYSISVEKDTMRITVFERNNSTYGGHEYISASLWYKSLLNSIKKTPSITSYHTGVDPTIEMSIVYFIDLPIQKESITLKNLIDIADRTIKEIEEEATYISKREVLRYINS